MENLKDEKGEFCRIVLLVARHRDADREAGLLSEDGIYPISAVLLFTFEDCKPIQSIQKTIQNGIESTL